MAVNWLWPCLTPSLQQVLEFKGEVSIMIKNLVCFGIIFPMFSLGAAGEVLRTHVLALQRKCHWSNNNAAQEKLKRTFLVSCQEVYLLIK